MLLFRVKCLSTYVDFPNKGFWFKLRNTYKTKRDSWLPSFLPAKMKTYSIHNWHFIFVIIDF